MSDRGREELRMVFLSEIVRAEETRIGAITLERTIESSGISDLQALRLIAHVILQSGMATEVLENGKRFPVDSYLKRAEKQGKWKQPIEAGGVRFRLARVPTFGLASLLIEEIQPGSAASWESWAAPFLTVHGFVQAWIIDSEYDYWQNAKDPLQYQAAGRSYEHLETKSNGLPPPLNRMEIDTSNNPGRWSFHSGYIEAVGATMWLSPLFWSMVGKDDKVTVLAAFGMDIRNLANGVTQIIAADRCFSDATTADVQRKLRSTLFNQEAE